MRWLFVQVEACRYCNVRLVHLHLNIATAKFRIPKGRMSGILTNSAPGTLASNSSHMTTEYHTINVEYRNACISEGLEAVSEVFYIPEAFWTYVYSTIIPGLRPCTLGDECPFG